MWQESERYSNLQCNFLSQTPKQSESQRGKWKKGDELQPVSNILS